MRYVAWLGVAAALALLQTVPAEAVTSGPPVSGIALGVYQPGFPGDLSKMARYEQLTGGHLAIVHWYAQWAGWQSAFDASELEAVAARGSLPLITWEPWTGVPSATPDPAWSLRAAILSGRSNAYIESWARGLADYGGPVLLRFAHEMNDQPVYPWAVGNNGNTASDYVAAWRHVRAIFARFHTENVRWVWNPNALGDAAAGTYLDTYQSLYPGDDEVDWVGLDIFNTGPNLNWGQPRWQSFAQALAAPYAAITTVSSKPLILPEVASTETGGSKAAWITSALTEEVGQFPRVQALVWFDVNKEQAWNLDSSDNAMQAWLAGLRATAGGASLSL
jgi:beta-mannanase